MEITERKIWRYQRYSEAWLTIHYHKKKTNNGQQKTTQKTRLNNMNPTEKQGWTRCSRRISTSCFTSGTSRVTLHRFMPVRGVNYQHCTITYKYLCLFEMYEDRDQEKANSWQIFWQMLTWLLMHSLCSFRSTCSFWEKNMLFILS